jgi:tetratricopeptide (TPR) repeat protein
MLWNTLGTVLTEQGDMAQSIVFFDEALRLDPGFVKARYNRANARQSLGDPLAGLVDLEQALAEPAPLDEAAMMRMARATMLIAAGDLERGWDAYESRLDPHYAEVTTFLSNRPRWTPADELTGRRLLVIGEQGLETRSSSPTSSPTCWRRSGRTAASPWPSSRGSSRCSGAASRPRG